jgi:histidinol-phosphate aminotransferase
MFANKYVKVLKPYPLVSHKAWELQGNEDVLKLDWNEATIPPSPKVKESIEQFLGSGNMHWYPDVNNIVLLDELAKYNDLPVENIQYFASSDSLHEYIVRTFIEPDDRILIVAPTYDNFRAVVESNGALTEFYYLDENFKLDLEHFENFLALHQPKIVYICNPNNPTGTMYDKHDIEQLISQFENIMFIVDEAYYEFTGNSCKDLVLDYENLLISRTFSKAFALASFRVGYTISSQHNIKLLSKIRNPKNISTFSQIAAISVLQDSQYMKNYVEEVNKAKEFFDAQLVNIGLLVFGDGGNFTLLKLDYSIKKAFIEYLEKNNIFVRDYGHVKGMENYLRITIGTMPQMQTVLKIIKKFFSEVKESN